MRCEQQTRVAPRANDGARLQTSGPEEPWPIGMRMAPDLSIIRVNQAGWDGPLLLSEPISKNEAKMPSKRGKLRLFVRTCYSAGYGAIPFLSRRYADSLKNARLHAMRRNSLGIHGLRQNSDFRNCLKTG